MTRAVFMGVGESCDERLPNTSILVEEDSEGRNRSVLLDCGFTVPWQYWRHRSDPEALDGLWISHFHGDHFFGVPALLLRFWEMKRRKPLLILGQNGIQQLVEETMDLAYPSFRKKLTYALDFMEMEPGKPVPVLGWTWQVAENEHGQRSFAVRIDGREKSLLYSGDGRPTEATLALARHCDLLIHEAYQINHATFGHGTIEGCIALARSARAPVLALVHLQRDLRRDRFQEVLALLKEVQDFRACLPEPGDVLEL
jgi:ribonuclease Z